MKFPSDQLRDEDLTKLVEGLSKLQNLIDFNLSLQEVGDIGAT
jgi:hypothetical protein